VKLTISKTEMPIIITKKKKIKKIHINTAKIIITPKKTQVTIAEYFIPKFIFPTKKGNSKIDKKKNKNKKRP
jgi:hypothetical protein